MSLVEIVASLEFFWSGHKKGFFILKVGRGEEDNRNPSNVELS